MRHPRPGGGAAQHLRHGPQVDVERRAGRSAAGGVPDRRRSAAGRRAREAGRALCRPPTRSPAISPPEWAERLGLRAGIPIPVGAFDAHWDAIGAGVPLGDVVNVVGTSTCIMAIGEAAGADSRRLRRGAGIDPSRQRTGIEAGLSATGDIFEAIARRAGTTVARAFERPGKLPRRTRPACCASPGTTATAPCW